MVHEDRQTDIRARTSTRIILITPLTVLRRQEKGPHLTDTRFYIIQTILFFHRI